MRYDLEVVMSFFYYIHILGPGSRELLSIDPPLTTRSNPVQATLWYLPLTAAVAAAAITEVPQ